MLSTSCRKRPRVLKDKPRTVSKPQRLLAVARCCRDCGLRLSALEDALHQCSKAFDWPFPAETICSASASCGQCRLVRLGANTLRGTTLSRLAELWETIRETDLSHSLDLPSGERLANGSAWLLMALKGREVLGLLSAERIAGTSSACLDSSGSGMKQKSETDASKVHAKVQTHSRILGDHLSVSDTFCNIEIAGLAMVHSRHLSPSVESRCLPGRHWTKDQADIGRGGGLGPSSRTPAWPCDITGGLQEGQIIVRYC